MENEEKELGEEKAIKNLSSETAQEMDESAEIENMKKVEAALFLSARFLSLQELVMLTDINPLMLRELIEKLINKYNSDESAIEIVVKEDMWKMDVSQEYVSMINKLATGSSEFTKAEQETLAVIAYKQPVKQSVIINIRGNKAYEHIKHFIDISLVQSKKLGRTKELKLSDDFFEYFHLQKKSDGSAEVIEVEKDGEDGEYEEKENENREDEEESEKEENKREKKVEEESKESKEDEEEKDKGEEKNNREEKTESEKEKGEEETNQENLEE